MVLKSACSSFYDKGEAGLRSAKFKEILVFMTVLQSFKMLKLASKLNILNTKKFSDPMSQHDITLEEKVFLSFTQYRTVQMCWKFCVQL